jgi:hypothetical protein
MFNNEKPLYALSVGEFKELLESFTGVNYGLVEQDKPVETDIVYIDEATIMMGYTKSTVYTKVSRKEIPVLSYGRPLTFSKKVLQNWMADGRPTLNEIKAKEFTNNQRRRL